MRVRTHACRLMRPMVPSPDGLGPPPMPQRSPRPAPASHAPAAHHATPAHAAMPTHQPSAWRRAWAARRSLARATLKGVAARLCRRRWTSYPTALPPIAMPGIADCDGRPTDQIRAVVRRGAWWTVTPHRGVLPGRSPPMHRLPVGLGNIALRMLREQRRHAQVAMPRRLWLRGAAAGRRHQRPVATCHARVLSCRRSRGAGAEAALLAGARMSCRRYLPRAI